VLNAIQPTVNGVVLTIEQRAWYDEHMATADMVLGPFHNNLHSGNLQEDL
jgi:hypothetical protein